jgi:hypothetical protein
LGLGYLAVLPFVVCAALVWTGGVELRARASIALLAYAAVVVSFIGAIHWGIAFSRVAPATSLFVWGVAPAIVAWLSMLAHPGVGLVTDAVALVVCYLVDRSVYPRQGLAIWLPLRLRLTVLATLCCLAGAAAS